MNLNMSMIETDDGSNKALKDFSISDGDVSVYFRDIKNHLIKHIRDAEHVFGCVAWLTEPTILDALASTPSSLVVQKEDFLRPDVRVPNNWKSKLRRQYEAIRCGVSRYDKIGTASMMSFASGPTIPGVVCVGNHNREAKPAHPRMHNKFLVFAKLGGEGEFGERTVHPYGVWTGSFNFTANAGASLENAIYISRQAIVDAYFEEYSQILALSESLDWTSDWIAPQWRIGS